MTTIDKNAGDQLDLEIEQSSVFESEFDVDDDQGNSIDLTNKDVFALVLQDIEEPHSGSNVIFEFTEQNGRVNILNATDGLFELKLTVSEVENLSFTREPYVLQIDDDRLLEGHIYIG